MFALRAVRLCAAGAALYLVSAGLQPLLAARDEVSLNFVNAEIGAVVNALGKLTGRNFLVDPRVKGTLNIVTNRRVSPADAHQIVLSALRLQGYTMIEEGSIVKVVPEAEAKQHAVPVSGPGGRARGDRLVTRVFAIQNESAAQLVPVLRPLVSPNNAVSAYAANNTLVVTDYAENLERIARIIEAIDVPASDAVVIPIRHASALDLASTVSRTLSDGTAGGTDPAQRVTIVPDPRTNSLLVRSDNPSRLGTVRRMVAALDQPGLGGNIRVIYLKNAQATKVAQTLRAVLSGESTAPAAAVTGAPAGTPVTAPLAGAQGQRPAPAAARSGGEIVQADPVTNSLIITAPEAIYNNIRRVVEQLDRRRAQVFVEALVAEVTADQASEFGIQWQTTNIPTGPSEATSVFGGTNFSSGGANIVNVAVNPASVASGLNLLVGKGTVTLPGTSTPILNLAALARFLESRANSNILSTPNLMMLDNEEARIVVGQNVPFVTGQYAVTGAGTAPISPFQTIERRDVGLTLRIRPQISEGGSILMYIVQESSSVVPTSLGSATGPVTNKRSIETVTLVDDGAIIALGGLVQDNYAGGVEKVPLLGDLPVVGNAFRYDTRNRTKTNLYVFLRPQILRDANAYKGITADRYEYVIGQQRTLARPEDLMRGEPPSPVLPPLGGAPAMMRGELRSPELRPLDGAP